MRPHRRSDGSWVFRFFEDGTKASRYRQVTLDAKLTKAEALAEYKRHVADASAKRGKGSPALTVADLARRWLDAPRQKPLSKGGRLTAETILSRHIVTELRRRPNGSVIRGAEGEPMLDDVLGGQLVEKLSPRDVDGYIEKRRGQGAEESTINRELGVLVSMLNWAATRARIIERSPLPRLTRLRETERSAYFTRGEWQAFVTAFDDPKAWEEHRAKVRKLGPKVEQPGKKARVYGGGRKPDSKASHAMRKNVGAAMAVFRALLLTGSRLGEIVGLTWDAVDFESGRVRIFQPKTERAKVLPLSPELRELLEAQRRGIGKALVFERPSGGAWESARLRWVFSLAKELAGVRDELRIHDLRHTAASWLTMDGKPERFVRDFLGHKDARMTARYSHLEPDTLQDAADAMGRFSRSAETSEAAPSGSARPKKAHRVTRG